MSQDVINLQSAQEVPGVRNRDVSFESAGVTVKGTLYMPTDGDGPFPGAVVTGAWTTVKEQMPGTYARELAGRGVAALAFDFRGWGESEGEPRYVEDPEAKTVDILAAAAFLQGQDGVDGANISGLGVCASSGYMATAVADSDHLSRLALVAPWLHDPELAAEVYGGRDAASGLIALADQAAAGPETVLKAASTTDESAPMFGAPYYTEADRGLIPEYDNKFNVLTWRPWLTYDAFASADRLTKRTLIVGSDGMALPPGAAAYEARTRAPVEKLWLDSDVSQFDFYDRPDVVATAADAVAKLFKR